MLAVAADQINEQEFAAWLRERVIFGWAWQTQVKVSLGDGIFATTFNHTKYGTFPRGSFLLRFGDPFF